MTSKRLVTLTGAAGMGKTRLALEVASQFVGATDSVAPTAHEFPDGVWLAELAPLADEALVTTVVASIFGLSEQPGRSLTDALTAFIAEKHMLVILDNCEHVVGACARLAGALLRACPRLYILATSREALGLPGEVIWRIPPLSMPDMADIPQINDMAGYDAVQLFVEHAVLAQPGFTFAPNDLVTAARICHRLDGMPLAIEMAAAQIAFLGLKGVAAGLDDRFTLLSGGSRIAVPHHQTLRATLDWSYALLTKPERALLARLSAFAGGWTAEAAQAVCADDGMQVLPILVQLVRKSLVATFTHQGDEQTRYRLLESVRQYADEKLRECGEADATRDQHLAYFLDMAEEPIELAGPRVDPWVRRMDPEYDNLRAAFNWSMVCDDEGEKAMRLVFPMASYTWSRGHVGEIRQWTEQALSRGNKAPTFARARALQARSGNMIQQGAYAPALRCAEEALALFRQTDDHLGLAWCLELLAHSLYNERAQAFAEEALPLFRELGSRDGEGRALRAVGAAALRAGDRARATQLLEQSIMVARWDAMECMGYLYDANPKRALELCARERVYWIQSGNLEVAPFILQAYATLLMAEGDYARARQMSEESIRVWQQVGLATQARPDLFSAPLPLDISDLSLPAWVPTFHQFNFVFVLLAFLELLLGNIDRARMRLDQSRRFAREAGIMVIEILAEFLTTTLTLTAGYTDAASRQAFECVRRFGQLGFRPGVVLSLVQVADVVAHRGGLRSACILIGAAEAHFDEVTNASAHLQRIPLIWLRCAQGAIISPTLAAARAGLGDAEFDAAYEEGQRMTLDEAVAFALGDDGP